MIEERNRSRSKSNVKLRHKRNMDKFDEEENENEKYFSDKENKEKDKKKIVRQKSANFIGTTKRSSMDNEYNKKTNYVTNKINLKFY